LFFGCKMSDRSEKNNDDLDKNVSGTRQRYVQNVKTEMIFFNFGLPSNPKYVNLGWEDVVPKIKALHELQVRLNIYLANGEKQFGKIDFPEAHRVIEYNFEENIDKSYVRFYSTRNDKSTEN
jgi:hypothetical protein